MTLAKMPVFRSLQVRFARAEQAIGKAGLCGVALMVVALVVVGLAWSERSRADLAPSAADSGVDLVRAPVASQANPPFAAEPEPELAVVGDVPLLLTQVKQIALGNGLGWTAADYRITPATDTQPASLEIRSTFKASYPRLRKMLSQILREVPASTVRELNMSRPSSDIAEVDAKLTIAVLLQDAPPAPSRAPAATAALAAQKAAVQTLAVGAP